MFHWEVPDSFLKSIIEDVPTTKSEAAAALGRKLQSRKLQSSTNIFFWRFITEFFLTIYPVIKFAALFRFPEAILHFHHALRLVLRVAVPAILCV